MDVRHRPPSLTITTILMVAVLATGACSRMPFVKQDFKRQEFERTTAEVNVKGNGRNNNSVAAARNLELAQMRLMSGDYPAAEKEALKALKLDPKSADAETVLAVVASRSGDPAGAGRHYLRAAEFAPDNGAVQSNYGVWLCREGRAAESLPWFDRALQDPRYTSPSVALANSGSCAARAGQDVRAGRDLRRAIALDPNNAAALGALAELEFRQGNAFEARAFSERRLSVAPADRGALQLASQIEEKLGDRVAAARYVQRMRAEFPETRGSGMGDDGKR